VTEFAQHHQIVAIPTLIRQLPESLKRIIGDLSDHKKILVGRYPNNLAGHPFEAERGSDRPPNP
jgi:hypothetical protein